MRHFLLSVLLAVSTGSNAGAQICQQPDEQQGFNLVALKSALMVGALSCAQENLYNTFMTRFQPQILAGQEAMDRYFGRADGLYGQIQQDDYTTQLANEQSAASISMGAGFCAANAALFDTVLALKSPADLQNFTDATPPALPMAFTACPVGPPLRPGVTVAVAGAARELVINNPPVARSPLPPPRRLHVRLARADHPARKPAGPPAEILATETI